MKFDILEHVAKAEQGAEFDVDLGGDNAFKLQVRKANMRDPQYFQAQEFLISVASKSDGATELAESMEDGVSTLPPERVAELTKEVGSQFDGESFSKNLTLLADYILDKLVVGWSGITISGTDDERPYDKDLLSRLLDSESGLVFQIFAFAITADNFGDTVEEAEKNS